MSYRERHPSQPAKTFEVGKCRRCGAAVEKGRRNWCGQTCIDAHMRARGFRYRIEGRLANIETHGVPTCDGCGAREAEVAKQQWAIILRIERELKQRDDDIWGMTKQERRAYEAAHRRKQFEVDHKTRLADGGTHEVRNLQLLCWQCHQAKTAREARGPGRAGAEPGLRKVNRLEGYG